MTPSRPWVRRKSGRMASVRTSASGSATNCTEQSNCAPEPLVRVEDDPVGALDPGPERAELRADHGGAGPGRVDMDEEAVGARDRETAAMSSVPPMLVPPVEAMTPAGRCPAARSARIAASSAPGPCRAAASSAP